jgi:hypothetical protein
MLEGKIFSLDKLTHQKVYLTNIDEGSCFVLLDEGNFEFKDALLEFTLDGVVFTSQVSKVSKYDQGIGLQFKGENNSPWNLTELCRICRDRGLFLI